MSIYVVPKDQCTIGDLLDQVQISKSLDANVSVYCKPCTTIDYMITVGVSINDIPRELFVTAEHTMKGDRQQKVQVLVTSNIPPRQANSQQVVLTQTRDGTVLVSENIAYEGQDWIGELMNLLEIFAIYDCRQDQQHRVRHGKSHRSSQSISMDYMHCVHFVAIRA